MIYDISQQIPGCAVWPGDPAPELRTLCSIDGGDVINLTAFSMCAHNGTHVDAPRHFLRDGYGVDGIPLDKLVGRAFVVTHEGNVTAADARAMLTRAAAHGDAARKILIRGAAVVTLEAAQVFADAGIDLIGNESQTVGPEQAPMAVHLALLGAGVVLLEGIRLRDVPDGVYLLHAAPLCLTGADGAPCRATLMTV